MGHRIDIHLLVRIKYERIRIPFSPLAQGIVVFESNAPRIDLTVTIMTALNLCMFHKAFFQRQAGEISAFRFRKIWHICRRGRR